MLLDGIAMTADEEPHFIDKPKKEDDPDIPEEEEEALEEIEECIDDGDASTDIGSALKKNANKVNGAIKSYVNGKGKKDKKTADCPAEAKEEDKAHFAKN